MVERAPIDSVMELAESQLSRRTLLRLVALAGMSAAAAPIIAACNVVGGSAAPGAAGTIKVGVLADMTGPLAVFGKSFYNTAQLAVEDVNAGGGVLGKQIEIALEDSASDNTIANTKAKKLVEDDGAVMVTGVVTSSMREAIKGTIVDRANKIYIYPNIYEGDSCHQNEFCTGPVAPQIVEPFIPYLFEKAGGKKLYYTGADYIFPRVSGKWVRQVVEANGGQIVGEEYFPLDATDFSASVQKIMSSGADIVYSNVIPPGIWTQIRQLSEAGFQKKGLFTVPYLEESALQAIPFNFLEGIPACLDFFQALTDDFDTNLVKRYHDRFKDGTELSANGAVGTYRAILLWAQAANAAGSIETEKVRVALDKVKLDKGPGGACEMVPSQHHLALNMYIGVAHDAKMVIDKELGKKQPQSTCNYPVN
jgi:branched-chain amino acid transport system substrate-binding protein